MRRLVFLSLVTALFVLGPESNLAGQQNPPKRKTPTFTTEDAHPVAADTVVPEVNITKSDASGTAVRNARSMLQSTLGKMADLNSVRTRLRIALPVGEREMTIQSSKPDRLRIESAQGEAILIGRKLYVKNTSGDWQVVTLPSPSQSAAGGFDFQMLLKKLVNDSRIRVSGQVLGDEKVDDVDTVAYEFTIVDHLAKSGVLQICVGKQDGFARRLFLIGPDVDMKIWFSNINEPVSIEPPM